jgi:SsrA-binding protein
VLTGSEVKSLRTGQSNIAESYASVEGGELWLINGYIATYKQAGVFGHEERRKRKLAGVAQGTVAAVAGHRPRRA